MRLLIEDVVVVELMDLVVLWILELLTDFFHAGSGDVTFVPILDMDQRRSLRMGSKVNKLIAVAI